MKTAVPGYLFFVAAFVLHDTYAASPEPRTPSVVSGFVEGFLYGLNGGTQDPATQQQEPDGEWGKGLCNEECTCGFPNRNTRIIGGKSTKVNEYPWVAALSRNRRIFCGATVITNLHVLTAAHCVSNSRLMWVRATTTVILAEHDITVADESPMITRRIASFVSHPNFRPHLGNLDGDIAIIRMSRPVEFTVQLAPACLPSPNQDFAGYNGIIAGWGRTSEKGKQSNELLAAVVPIYSQEYCLESSKYEKGKVTEHMMCAGRPEGGVDSCQGDSGGGLFITDSYKRMVVAGVVSWGEGCAKPRRPGVYTRVNHYLEWIQFHTKDACFCA